jgi:lipoyl(octanoyl) transferase
VAALEEAMIRTCADDGVAAGRHDEHRGAWVGHRKIGAVGVHLARWITSHGLAFNVAPDLRHFQVIVPCGIADPRLGVTSLAQELEAKGRRAPPMAEVEARLAAHLAEALERRAEPASPPLQTITVVALAHDGRVLLLKRSPARGGFWQPVTGRIEPGETAAQAARRELHEETGADVPVEPLDYRHGFGIDPVLMRSPTGEVRVAVEEAFVARLPPGFEPRLSEEHVEAAFVPAAEAAATPRFPGPRRAIRLAAGLPAPALVEAAPA